MTSHRKSAVPREWISIWLQPGLRQRYTPDEQAIFDQVLYVDIANNPHWDVIEDCFVRDAYVEMEEYVDSIVKGGTV